MSFKLEWNGSFHNGCPASSRPPPDVHREEKAAIKRKSVTYVDVHCCSECAGFIYCVTLWRRRQQFAEKRSSVWRLQLAGGGKNGRFFNGVRLRLKVSQNSLMTIIKLTQLTWRHEARLFQLTGQKWHHWALDWFSSWIKSWLLIRSLWWWWCELWRRGGGGMNDESHDCERVKMTDIYQSPFVINDPLID